MPPRVCLVPRNATLLIVMILLGLHVTLVAWLGYVHSPNSDEVAHLPCGMAIWEEQRYDLYCVNPPLVRSIAAAPVHFLTNARLPQSPPASSFRQEFQFGNAFLQVNGPNAIWYFRLARWCCIPFSILGALVSYFWSAELFGKRAGIATLTLWCFEPNILCWASTICPDLAAASTGLLTCYCFWHWLKTPGFVRATGVGVALGMCELSKMTWLPLFGVLPGLWAVWLCFHRREYTPKLIAQNAAELTWAIVVALYLLNLGYLFDGTFRAFSDYDFHSEAMVTLAESPILKTLGVTSTLLPFPSEYLYGIDLQKCDFERGLDSYQMGIWSQRGWWHYYLLAFLFKVPLGVLLLFILAFGIWGYQSLSRVKRAEPLRAMWCDVLMLLLPAMFLVFFVSAHTGFSRHFRYVLPALPFFLIWTGMAFSRRFRKTWVLTTYVPWSLVVWAATSSLISVPHSFSYFNEVAWGPRGGHAFLLDSNIDWQQDVLKLRTWLDEHKEARPMNVAYYGDTRPELFGLVTYSHTPVGKNAKRVTADDSGAPCRYGPLPGWYAVSVHCIRHPERDYSYFFHFEPVAMAGYSIYIYHISLREANRVRRLLGMPQLPDDRRHIQTGHR